MQGNPPSGAASLAQAAHAETSSHVAGSGGNRDGSSLFRVCEEVQVVRPVPYASLPRENGATSAASVEVIDEVGDQDKSDFNETGSCAGGMQQRL